MLCSKNCPRCKTLGMGLLCQVLVAVILVVLGPGARIARAQDRSLDDLRKLNQCRPA